MKEEQNGIDDQNNLYQRFGIAVEDINMLQKSSV